MLKVVGYIDEISEARRDKELNMVRGWARRNGFRMILVYGDQIRPRSKLPNLERALKSCRRNSAVLAVAKSHVLMRNSRFSKHMFDGLKDGVNIVSVDLPSMSNLPPVVQRSVWLGMFEAGENLRRRPSGYRRDVTSLTEDDKAMVKHLKILLELGELGYDDQLYADSLNRAGVRLPGGTKFGPKSAKRVRKKLLRMLKEFEK